MRIYLLVLSTVFISACSSPEGMRLLSGELSIPSDQIRLKMVEASTGNSDASLALYRHFKIYSNDPIQALPWLVLAYRQGSIEAARHLIYSYRIDRSTTEPHLQPRRGQYYVPGSVGPEVANEAELAKIGIIKDDFKDDWHSSKPSS